MIEHVFKMDDFKRFLMQQETKKPEAIHVYNMGDGTWVAADTLLNALTWYNINLDFIRNDLDEIYEECTNVQYYIDEDSETLLDALDGDEDEAFEFKMMFCDLVAECERMSEDLREEYIPECFDLFFVAIGAGGSGGGGLLGYDSFEEDYFGLSCTDGFAESEAAKKLKKLTKEQLIEASHLCFKVYLAYIGIRHRYDCLKSAMDILKDKNTEYLQVVRQIEKAYEKANEDEFHEWLPSFKEFDRIARNMPDTAWIQ